MKAIRFLGGILALGLLAQAQPSAPPAAPPATQPATPPAKTSLAVYPVEPAGSDPALAPAITATLVARLTPSPKLQVIEEAMLKAVMERQGMNISDACDDTSCQVEVGKLVKAQKMITGRLAKMGHKYTLFLSLVNIGTGVTEFNTEDSCLCSEDNLDELVAAAVAKIRNHFGENLPVPALPQSPPAAYSAAPAVPPPANSKSNPHSMEAQNMDVRQTIADLHSLNAPVGTSSTINLNDPEVQQYLAINAKAQKMTKEQFLFKYFQDPNEGQYLRSIYEKDLDAWKKLPPIAKAVANNDLAQVQQLLAQDPSLIQIQGESNDNLLFQARSPEMASFLIGKGLSISSKTSDGSTPIAFAVSRENKKMVEFYISQGADVNVEYSGTTLLDLALTHAKHNVSDARAQESKEIADLLREHGAKKGRKF